MSCIQVVRTLILGVVASVVAASNLCGQQSHSGAEDGHDIRISAEFGVAHDTVDGKVLLAEATVTDDFIDFQRDFQFEDEVSTRFGIEFDIGRWSFVLGFHDTNYFGEGTLNRPLNFGGTVFDVATVLRTDFRHSYYRAEAYYWFDAARVGEESDPDNSGVQSWFQPSYSPNYSSLRWAIGGGLHIFDLEADSRGTAGGQADSRQKDDTAPVLTIGGRLQYQVAERVLLMAQFQGFASPPIGGIRPIFLDATAGVDIRVASGMSIGLKAGYFLLDVDIDVGERGVDREVLDYRMYSARIMSTFTIRF